MPILLHEDYQRPLPKMYAVHQAFDHTALDDICACVHHEIQKKEIQDMLHPGMKVVVAVGSRGICHLSDIVHQLIVELKAAGTIPVILGAMGSHGGGTEEGQMEILHSYGITEESMGVPVITKNKVDYLGETEDGIQVFFDSYCLEEADLIIPVNRVKLHTDFVDTIQSGLCKMLTIGLGHHRGCSALHESDFSCFGKTIKDATRLILERCPVGFGLAILENAYDQTAMIEAVSAENMISREEELLRISMSYMPQLMIPEIDILIVEQIGKDICGAGFDPNILGKSYIRDSYILPVPDIQRMILLGISEASHGNAIGIGAFDIITKSLFEQLDLDSIYTNAVAIKVPEDCKIPLIASDEKEALHIAIKTLRHVDLDHLRIVRIKDTLHLETIQVSEALLPIIESNEKLTKIDAKP